MKAVILCGGKGTRLGKLTEEIPKPLLLIGDKPVLEYQVNNLKECGITDIIFLNGYLGHMIESYFGSGQKWGVKITHINEKAPLGTAGAVKQLEQVLHEPFLVLYGDEMLYIDFNRMIQFHNEKKSPCTILVHPNDHPYDSDLVKVNKDMCVTKFISKPHPEGLMYQNLVNAALYLFTPDIFKHIPTGEKLDFGKHIFPKMTKEGNKIYAYNTPEYIKDMGTLERLEKVNRDYNSGKINNICLKNKRKAIFLDRDGVINYDVDNLHDINKFKLLPKVIDAIKLINKSEYLVIIVTNQPVIAKGMLSENGLEEIHQKLETELGNAGSWIDAIYYCPHHPDKGFSGEIPELKIKCTCRKPGIGMILQASERFNIDLKHSWIIGDAKRDIQAGHSSGLNTVLVKRNQENYEECNIETIKSEDLYSAVNVIIK